MAKVVKQYRFFGENSSKNYPEKSTLQDWVDGNVFLTAGTLSITQLGIQTLPGTKVYLNNGMYPTIIGLTGIFDLDLEGLEISNIKFDRTSMDLINNTDSGFLIVDFVYNDNTEEEEF